MIPPADESGYLPPGIHRATLDEIQARFGELSELRRVQMESVRWMVELAVRRRRGEDRFERKFRHGYNGIQRRGLCVAAATGGAKGSLRDPGAA